MKTVDPLLLRELVQKCPIDLMIPLWDIEKERKNKEEDFITKLNHEGREKVEVHTDLS